MSQGTKIEWADDTINFAGGCSEARLAGGKMDPACVHCYARLMSVRSDGMMAALGKESIYEDVAERGEGNTARWTGAFRWDRELRDECAAAGVPLLHKQNGEHIEPEKARRGDVWLVPRPTLTEGVEGMHTQLWQPGDAGAEAGRWSKFKDAIMRRVGKKKAGRELDGRTWDEIPSVAS